MPRQHSLYSICGAVVLVAAMMGAPGPARAAIISPTPTLPPLGVAFAAAGVVGCFPLAGVCGESGVLTFTSVVSSTFNPAGQDIVANATFTGEVTTLSHVPIGTLQLTGTVEEEVLGRTFPTQTGTWNTELLAVSLSGPVLGHTLTMTLGSTPSTGGASVEPLTGHENEDHGPFVITSFFDVFVDLSLDSPTPLPTTRGPIHLAVPAPEPASLSLLSGAVLGLAALRRGRRAA